MMTGVMWSLNRGLSWKCMCENCDPGLEASVFFLFLACLQSTCGMDMMLIVAQNRPENVEISMVMKWPLAIRVILDYSFWRETIITPCVVKSRIARSA